MLKLSISCVRISFNLFSPPIIASFALSNTRSWYQNAAARLVSGARRHDHITTPILATLHRLPVRQRVIFKTALLLYTTQRHVIWPTSVPTASTDCRCHSRSAVSGALLVPWTRTSTGQRSFAVYGPRTWNRLLCPRPSDHQNCRCIRSNASSRPTCSSTRQCWLQL